MGTRTGRDAERWTGEGTSGRGGGSGLSGFLLVWFAGFLPFTSVFLAAFGLNWWLSRAPGGGALLGVTVGVANVVALLVAVLLAGAMDRMDRPSMLVGICAATAAGLVLLLPSFLLGPDHFGTVALAVLVYVFAEIIEALQRAASETTLADLAPDDWTPSRTASYVGVQPQVARLVAPALGGALLASGVPWALPVAASAFALLAALPFVSADLREFVTRNAPKETSGGGGSARSAIRESLRDARMAVAWMRGRPVMLFLLVVGFACNLVVYPFYSLLPVFIGEMELEGGAALYGSTAAAYGAGMLLSTGLFMVVSVRFRRPALPCAVTMLAVVAVLWSATVCERASGLIVLVGLLGALFVVLVVIAGGTWLEAVPGEVRVRVLALKRLVAFGSIPLGTSIMGLGGAAFGFVPTLRALLAFVLVILAVAWLALRIRERETDVR